MSAFFQKTQTTCRLDYENEAMEEELVGAT